MEQIVNKLRLEQKTQETDLKDDTAKPMGYEQQKQHNKQHTKELKVNKTNRFCDLGFPVNLSYDI